MISNSWTLEIGCHRKTITSRDCTFLTHDSDGQTLNNLNDCIALAETMRINYAHCGYFLWYAHAVSPEGEKFRDIVFGTFYY